MEVTIWHRAPTSGIETLGLVITQKIIYWIVVGTRLLGMACRMTEILTKTLRPLQTNLQRIGSLHGVLRNMEVVAPFQHSKRGERATP
jgi:hypothetical protein